MELYLLFNKVIVQLRSYFILRTAPCIIVYLLIACHGNKVKSQQTRPDQEPPIIHSNQINEEQKLKLSIKTVETQRLHTTGSNSIFQQSEQIAQDTKPTPDYATQWIPIEGVSKEYRIIRIKNEVKGLLNQIDEKKIPLLSLAQAESLNSRWQSDKELQNKNWLDNLFKKEEEFVDLFQKYIELVLEKKRVDGLIATRRDEIEAIDAKIRFQRERKNQITIWQDKLKEDYNFRLANVPISIFLVGRAKISHDLDLRIAREAITDEIIKKAIAHINGSKILAYRLVKDDALLKSLIARIEEGYAQISDTYHRNQYKTIGSDIYSYQLLRVDVFPFNRRKLKFSTEQRPSEATKLPLGIRGVEAFKVSDNADSLESFLDNRLEPFNAHHLNEAERKFVKSQVNIVKMSNNKVQDEIQKHKENFESKRNEYSSTIQGIDSLLYEYEREKKEKSVELEKEKIRLTQLNKDIDETLNRYTNAKEAYKIYYERKIGFVNRFEQEAVPRGTILETFLNMAEKSLEVLNELKQGYSTAVVFVESSENAIQNIRQIIKQEVNYIPQIEAFRILYITYPNVGDDANLLLNVAYRIRWTTQRSPLEMITDFMIGGLPKKVLLDHQSNSAWYLTSSSTTSPNYADIPFDGFKLPAIENLSELAHLRQNHLDIEDEDIFAKVGWSIDYPYLAQNETINEHDQVYKAFDFASGTERMIRAIDDVYVVWYKEITSSEKQ